MKTLYIALDSVKRFPKVDMRYWEEEPSADEVAGMATWSRTYSNPLVKVVFYLPSKPTAIQKKACEAVVQTFVRSRV